MSPAPVVLFTFNRPHHTERTLAALAANERADETELVIYSDGPRTPADRAIIEPLRERLARVDGFASTRLVARQANRGLAGSIVDGVGAALEKHQRVIVLEDDMVTSRYFLRYMNDALAMYQHDDQVASIHGYCYPVARRLPETFFLKGSDCWGWATWRRAWRLYQEDGQALLQQLTERGLLARFDFDNSFPYTRMLRRQIANKNDSWAIRWYASTLLADKLCLYPGRSLVHNIGNDASGIHSQAASLFDTEPSDTPVRLKRLPLTESAEALGAFSRFLRGTRPGFTGQLLRRLAGIARRFRT